MVTASGDCSALRRGCNPRPRGAYDAPMIPRTALPLALALLAASCADDIASQDDLDSRDYTDASACPRAIRSADTWDGSVCDRGDGQAPRYVAVPSCLQELRLRQRPGTLFTVTSTSPNAARCVDTVTIFTLADLRRGRGFESY